MSHEGIEIAINNIFFWITWFFGLVGAAIIIFGAIVCIIKYVKSLVQNKEVPIKTLLAHQLALGLEFMLAGEILKTVITTNRTTNELLMLVAIVVLRGSLSLLIHWELKNEEKQTEVKAKKTKKLADKVNDA